MKRSRGRLITLAMTAVASFPTTKPAFDWERVFRRKRRSQGGHPKDAPMIQDTFVMSLIC